MDGNNPKVSFIPKGSLVREESFLERRRPQSVMGVIAAIAFLASVSAYGGLYYLNDTLNQKVAEKTVEINKAQQEFKDAPEVNEARVFRVRADLAKSLLDSHTVTSPVFTFLSKNTTESILYDKFNFKNDGTGATLDLTGEAPTYAALAYQADVFRQQTKELSNFSVKDVILTKFGTITFSLSMTFAPSYLLYTKSVSTQSSQESEIPAALPVEVIPEDVVPAEMSTSTTSSDIATSSLHSLASEVEGGWEMTPQGGATTTSTTAIENQSILRSLWSKFKFW